MGNQVTDFQSVSLCYPIRTACPAQESKELYQVIFKEVYDFALDVSKNGLDEYRPMTVLGTHDGKATFHVLARGGGAKVVDLFCPYCTISSKQILETSCHWPVCDETVVRQAQESLTRDGMHDISTPLYFESKPFLTVTKDKPLFTEPGPNQDSNYEHIAFDHASTAADDQKLIKFMDRIILHVKLRKKYGRMPEIHIPDINAPYSTDTWN